MVRTTIQIIMPFNKAEQGAELKPFAFRCREIALRLE
jgi:hypothetical protein